MIREIASAYSETGAAWQEGPGVIYDRLAEVAVDLCPAPMDGALVLDVGAGTGAMSRAAQSRGARAVALDRAWGMLAALADQRPPAVVGDALALPFPDGSFDVVVAGFSLNHLPDPVSALRECRRVGAAMIVTAYAEDDGHPVREAVEAALSARGWAPDPWYHRLRAEAAPLLATADRASAAALAAGWPAPAAQHLQVRFDDLSVEQLVSWRMGMAQTAPFVAALSPADRAAAAAEAARLLGPDAPPLVRSVIVLVA